MKPRLRATGVLVSQLDFSKMEIGQTKLYLDGEECIYEGSHFDSLIWLRVRREVLKFHQRDVLAYLSLTR